MPGFGMLLAALEMEAPRFPDWVFTALRKYPDLSFFVSSFGFFWGVFPVGRGMAVQAWLLQLLLGGCWCPEPAGAFVPEFLALASVTCGSVRDAARFQVLGNSRLECQCLFFPQGFEQNRLSSDVCSAWFLQVLGGAVPWQRLSLSPECWAVQTPQGSFKS